MKIIDEKRSSLDSLIYVFFFLGTLGIVFSLKGMYSDQPMLWLSKPLAWGIIIGFALTLAGLILRLANLVQLSRSIRWIAIAYNFAIPFVTLGVLIGTFQMNAMPSFGAFLNEYSDVITAPALLPCCSQARFSPTFSFHTGWENSSPTRRLLARKAKRQHR